jgi:hypothetical protein
MQMSRRPGSSRRSASAGLPDRRRSARRRVDPNPIRAPHRRPSRPSGVCGASAPQHTSATASGARATCTDVGEASFSAYRVVMWARWMTGAQSAGWDRGPGWPMDGWRWVYTMMCSPFSEGDCVRRLGRVLGRTGAGGAVNAEPAEKWRRIFGREPARECPGRVRRARSAQPPPTAPATTRPLRRSGPLPTGFNGLTAHAQ